MLAMSLHSIADSIWLNCDTLPKSYTNLVVLDFKEVERIIDSNDVSNFIDIVNKLCSGSLLILRNSFSLDEIKYIKSKGMQLMRDTPSTFYKMDKKIPNHWRDITSENSNKYGVPVVKQSMYFFHWNGEKDLFKLLNRRWRIFKILGGKSPY